jgi:uncharacterized protein (TIGR03435 family)
MRTTMRVFAGVAISALLCNAAFAQAAATPPAAAAPPAFALADVHESAPISNPYMRGGMLRGDRYIVRYATMVDLISTAYKVDPLNVIGGPSWLELDRFDISAKAPPTTTQETARLMLRALLADRFKLDVQVEVKPQPAYLLTAGKSQRLKEADGSGEPGCQFKPPPKDAAPATRMNVAFACHNTTMESFAQFLHQVASPYLPKLIVDSSGLKGAWDFDIQWTYQPAAAGADSITIFDALDKQLGLKLELKSAPLPAVVVNSVNEKPTPNPPELAANLPPPPPAEFEVAIIRPHAPKEKHFGIQINGGNINFQFGSLETLIAFAWDIDKAMIVRGSFVLNQDQDFFDIQGKASSDAPPTGPASGPGIDIDDLREMMRSLLADRFKLKVHTEVRPYLAYILLPGNPKMKKADPANRAACNPGPGPDGKDPRLANPALTRVVWCQNMTMSQLAAEFRTLAPGDIKTPVLDSTGLTGAYDFALYWTGENDGRSTPPPSDGPATSDPSTGIPLPIAVNKQLGVKLEKQMRPVPMLVIDHIEEKPTEN